MRRVRRSGFSGGPNDQLHEEVSRGGGSADGDGSGHGARVSGSILFSKRLSFTDRAAVSGKGHPGSFFPGRKRAKTATSEQERSRCKRAGGPRVADRGLEVDCARTTFSRATGGGRSVHKPAGFGTAPPPNAARKRKRVGLPGFGSTATLRKRRSMLRPPPIADTGLNAEQYALFLSVIQCKRWKTVVSAMAGTGKTYTARVIATEWLSAHSDRRLILTAWTCSAAQHLYATITAGMPKEMLLRTHWQSVKGLTCQGSVALGIPPERELRRSWLCVVDEWCTIPDLDPGPHGEPLQPSEFGRLLRLLDGCAELYLGDVDQMAPGAIKGGKNSRADNAIPPWYPGATFRRRLDADAALPAKEREITCAILHQQMRITSSDSTSGRLVAAMTSVSSGDRGGWQAFWEVVLEVAQRPSGPAAVKVVSSRERAIAENNRFVRLDAAQRPGSRIVRLIQQLPTDARKLCAVEFNVPGSAVIRKNQSNPEWAEERGRRKKGKAPRLGISPYDLWNRRVVELKCIPPTVPRAAAAARAAAAVARGEKGLACLPKTPVPAGIDLKVVVVDDGCTAEVVTDVGARVDFEAFCSSGGHALLLSPLPHSGVCETPLPLQGQTCRNGIRIEVDLSMMTRELWWMLMSRCPSVCQVVIPKPLDIDGMRCSMLHHTKRDDLREAFKAFFRKGALIS